MTGEILDAPDPRPDPLLGLGLGLGLVRRRRRFRCRHERRRPRAPLGLPPSARPRDHHRAVRRGPQHRREVPRGPRLVRRRQLAAGAAVDDGRARRCVRAARSAGSRSSSTCVAGRSSPTCATTWTRCRNSASHPRRAVPRGRRRRADPPVRAASADRIRCKPRGGSWTASTAERGCCCPNCAARPTSCSTPPTSTSTSCAPRSTRRSASRVEIGYTADGALVRLQVRPAAGRRRRGRLPVPAESRTGSGACCARSPARTRKSATTCSVSRARRSSWTSTTALLKIVGEGYVREGKRYLTLAVGCTGGKHRSVAMAEQIAGRLAGDGVGVRVVHRDLGRE